MRWGSFFKLRADCIALGRWAARTKGRVETVRQDTILLHIFLIALVTGTRLLPATLEVHSEFLRVDPQGEILAIDATPQPREILSPAMARNGFASFHVVVRSPRITNYFLFAATNPPGVLRTTLYKEEFVNRGGGWIPDTLTLLRAPNFGAIPDGEANIPGQTACAYLLDVWVPPETPAGTVRLEVQLKAGVWVIYPMEVRVLPAVVPRIRSGAARALPAIEERADTAVDAPLAEYLNGHRAGAAYRKQTAPATLREVIRRNAVQDMALAQSLDRKILVPALKEKVASSSGGGEWYLGIRDLIYRLK